MQPSIEQLPPDTATPTATRRTLTLQFTGSGSEYFRIWIVNTLLTIISFGLYIPYARARKLRYFYGNTVLDGHAFGFHGDPSRILRGFLVMSGLVGIYIAVLYFQPQWEWVPGSIFAVIWPTLWCQSLIFRMRNTSWRGVRFGFVGSVKGTYIKFLPLLLPTFAFLLLLGSSALGQSETAATPASIADKDSNLLKAIVGYTFIAIIGLYPLAFPWMLAQLKAYQHRSYSYGGQVADVQASALAKGTYWVCFLTLVFTLLLLVIVGTAYFLALSPEHGIFRSYSPESGIIFALQVWAMTILMTHVFIAPIYVSRMQNLIWNNTFSPMFQFRCHLRTRTLLAINVVNWLMIIVSFGLFCPFAAVRTARVRLTAITLEVEGDIEALVGRLKATGVGVLADSANEFAGIDLGL